jgi:hypothetical protein
LSKGLRISVQLSKKKVEKFKLDQKIKIKKNFKNFDLVLKKLRIKITG